MGRVATAAIVAGVHHNVFLAGDVYVWIDQEERYAVSRIELLGYFYATVARGNGS